MSIVMPPGELVLPEEPELSQVLVQSEAYVKIGTTEPSYNPARLTTVVGIKY